EPVRPVRSHQRDPEERAGLVAAQLHGRHRAALLRHQPELQLQGDGRKDRDGQELLSSRAVTGRWLVRGVAVAALLALATIPACRGEGQRPNVLLITIDTLRADRLRCYRYGPAPTPAAHPPSPHPR